MKCIGKFRIILGPHAEFLSNVAPGILIKYAIKDPLAYIFYNGWKNESNEPIELKGVILKGKEEGILTRKLKLNRMKDLDATIIMEG